MAAETTGLERTFGPLVQSRISELKRVALVAGSEIVEESVPAGTFPRVVTVVRRQQTAPQVSSRGKPATWSETLIVGLVASVRTYGKWIREREEGIWIRGDERVISIADLPLTGAGATLVPAHTMTTTDRVRYVDPVFGDVTFQVTDVGPRVAAGIVTVLVKYARED